MTPQAPGVPQTLVEPLARDLLKVTVHRLENGLTLYLSPNHQKPRVSAWIAVRAGGKHDPEKSTGMAHYLEHMLFKGTRDMGTLDYKKESIYLDRIKALYEELYTTKDEEKRAAIYKKIDEQNILAAKFAIANEMDKAYRQMGFSGVNAFTGDEYTVYVCDFPANRAEHWARLEANRFVQPVFRLFQTEIETVYEEKNRSADNAEWIISEALNKILYKKHPYGQRTVLGSIDHLKNPSLAKMYAYFDTYYVPNNMGIFLAGDFNREEMLALLTRHFGAWKAKDLPEVPQWPLPKLDGIEKDEVLYEAEEKILISYSTVPMGHPDAEALQVMNMLIGNANTGILKITLTQAQKVKDARSGISFQNDAGDWTLSGVPKQGQTLEQVEELLMGTIAKLKAGDFSDDDIRAIITNFEVREKAGLESNGSRVSNMAFSFLGFREWRQTAETLDRLRVVRKADVMRVVKKYISNDRALVYRRNGKPERPSITKPNFTKIEIDPSKQSKFLGTLVALPAKPVEPKWIKQDRDYWITEHPWGRLFSAPNPVNDLFTLTIGFDVGRRPHPHRNLGAAISLLGLSGGGDLNAEAFEKKLYALGSSMTLGAGNRQAGIPLSGLDREYWPNLITLSGLDKNLRPTVELMFDRFFRPKVEKGTLEKMVEVALGAHQDNKKNPGYVHYALRSYALRGHDSKVLAEFNDRKLKDLKTPELLSLVSKLWEYEFQVCYMGNRAPGEVAELINPGKTRHLKPPPMKPDRYETIKGPRVYFVHRDMVQAQVSVSAPDEIFDPAMAVDYSFLGSYLGGGMSALIFQEIREARALAYAAGGGYSPGAIKGDQNILSGTVGTQADKTVEATELLRDLLRKPPMTQERFSETAKAIEAGYRTNPIGFRAVPGVVRGWEQLGFPPGDPRPDMFKKVGKYTLDDLAAFSSRFKARDMTIAVLGHRDKVNLSGLAKLGEVVELQLSDIFPY